MSESTGKFPPRTWIVIGYSAIILGLGVCFWMSPRREPIVETPVTTDSPMISQTVRLKRPAAVDQSYVGSAACTACHAEISRKYQRHPMSRSLISVSAAKPVEDFDKRTSFTAGPCEYRIERKDGRTWHHEVLQDKNGDILYDQSVEVQFALGSGVRGRSYLTDRQGAFFQSPIGWYTGKSWDLSPGYTPGRHQGFTRRVTDGCLQCHAGRVNASPSHADFFPEPAFHEASIGCERCHGPGEKHVKYRQLGLKGKELEQTGPDPMVNPGKLAPAQRDAVCYQCHLQAVDRIIRYGRGHHDFRPGHKLNDIWTVFLNGTGVSSAGSTEVVTQVEQMQSSQCFQKSAGKMGCISCHDPHDMPDVEQRTSYFMNKCIECHTKQTCSLSEEKRQQSAPQGSCVHCHMPRLKAEVVPHTTQTDHRIQRRRTREKPASRGQSFAVFQEPGFTLSNLEQARARGLLLIRLVEGTRRIDLASECEALLKRSLAAAPDDPEVLEALGAACLVQERPAEAEQYWRTLLELTPQHERALHRLGSLLQDSGRHDEAEQWFSKALAVNPWLTETLGRQIQLLGQQGHWDQGIPLAHRALELDPRMLPLYKWLGQAYQKIGSAAESQRFSRLGDRIETRLSK